MKEFLTGTWYVQFSNLPMWKHDDIHSLSFSYTPMIKNGKEVLADEVRYFKKDKLKTIEGYDTVDKDDNSKISWRGKGILMLITSTWKIEWMNESRTAGIISFSKTLFTPAGADIITRDKFPAEALKDEAVKVFNSSPTLHGPANKNLFKVSQQ